MKQTIIDIIIAFLVLTLLLVGAWLIGRNKTPKETFSPPSWGVGRETEEDIPAESETPEIETENAPETTPASYQQVTSKLPASYQQVTESVVENIYVPDTDELVEVVPEADPIIETDIDALIVQIAAEYGLPWELVKAVCYVESNFNPWAKSDTGDYGIMQVYYGVWNELGVDLKNDTIQYDTEYNLRVGCGILKDKIEQSNGDFTTALIRYNIGDKDALKLFEQGIFSTDYTNKVLSKYYEYIREG